MEYVIGLILAISGLMLFVSGEFNGVFLLLPGLILAEIYR